MQKTKEGFPKYLFHEGTNFEADKLFCPKLVKKGEKSGFNFHVWAPNAKAVSLVGDFNLWKVGTTPMVVDEGGIWEVTVFGLKVYDNYKFAITDKRGKVVLKADPFGLHFETSPSNASKLYDISNYNWNDSEWLANREKFVPYAEPINIYEVHLGSWRRHSDGNVYSYRQLADELVSYVKKMNYTHIELMPLTEYPYDASWGYQVTGLFAPTSRYGTPADLMYFVDKCHESGIGVILDWVIAHFPKDVHGLAMFDGTPLYEYADPRKGEHKEWGTKVFDYGKSEVQSFLISAASFWFRNYHIDGLRVDAVAAMLYLDYNRKDGEWLPNKEGGNYNIEAKEFLQRLNTAILTQNKGVMTIAEESTCYPMITKPPFDGGLGFNFKWNMGWMNDSLEYISANPFYRKDMHDKLTFSISYAYSENYILPLSHDEVVHGKKSIIDRIPTEYNEKFEGVKAFYGYMMTHPGKKLLFMGSEFGQFIEWKFDAGLDWLLLDYPKHKMLQTFVKDLNAFYLKNPPLFNQDCKWEGFRWVSVDDNTQNIISYLRYDESGEYLLTVINFSPIERKKYSMGVPENKKYKVEFSSILKKYGGNSNAKPHYNASSKSMHGLPFSISMTVPANSVLILKSENILEEI
ncbi:MAG: 1,4-alpha-glucan branching protein GlgB [Clostridia bacterium]